TSDHLNDSSGVGQGTARATIHQPPQKGLRGVRPAGLADEGGPAGRTKERPGRGIVQRNKKVRAGVAAGAAGAMIAASALVTLAMAPSATAAVGNPYVGADQYIN